MNPIFDVTNLNNPIDFGRWGFFYWLFSQVAPKRHQSQNGKPEKA